MSEMKTLTINGHKYKVQDEDAVSFEQAQQLNEEQRSTARQNVGALHEGLCSQGRNAKYNVYTPGWKRILNIIRSTSGVLTLGATKAINEDRSIQSLGLVLTGNVNFPQVGVDTEPMIRQLYNHEQGHNNTADTTAHARITAVRVGYPSKDATKLDGFYTTNPINCYVDVYVDFDNSQEDDHVQLTVNFAGYSDSHNCKAITEETDAVDTGYYGEPLTYYEFTPIKNGAVQIVDDRTVGAHPWSSQNIVDKLCPSFTESDSAVILDCPLEGYPLHIESYDSPVIHLGKNLVGHNDFSNLQTIKRVISCENGVYTVEFTADVYSAIILTAEGVSAADIPDVYWKNHRLPPGRYTFSVNQEGTDTYDDCYAIVILDDGGKHRVRTGTYLPQWSTIDGFYCTKKTFKKGTKISFTVQIEVGDKATDHEPCQMEVYDLKMYEEDGPEWVCEDVMPMSERDMFFTAYSEDGYDVPLTVTGKKDPVALLNKLEATVNALLGG